MTVTVFGALVGENVICDNEVVGIMEGLSVGAHPVNGHPRKAVELTV